MTDTAGWVGYVAGFHSQRAGITEDVLERARDDAGRTPYDWAAEPVRPGLCVLDLACGSAPMHARLRARSYIGLDLSAAELAVAASRRVPVAFANASRLPVADGSVDAVVISMALMLVPLPTTLHEVKRVLRPGGVFVATFPASRPMPPADWLRYARLCLALRHPSLIYPNGRALSDVRGLIASAGLTLVSDDARAFACDVSTGHLADQLFRSLYLPDVEPRRMDAGRQVVRGWAGSTITTPIRRVVAATPAGSRRDAARRSG